MVSLGLLKKHCFFVELIFGDTMLLHWGGLKTLLPSQLAFGSGDTWNIVLADVVDA